MLDDGFCFTRIGSAQAGSGWEDRCLVFLFVSSLCECAFFFTRAFASECGERCVVNGVTRKQLFGRIPIGRFSDGRRSGAVRVFGRLDTSVVPLNYASHDCFDRYPRAVKPQLYLCRGCGHAIVVGLELLCIKCQRSIRLAFY